MLMVPPTKWVALDLLMLLSANRPPKGWGRGKVCNLLALAQSPSIIEIVQPESIRAYTSIGLPFIPWLRLIFISRHFFPCLGIMSVFRVFSGLSRSTPPSLRSQSNRWLFISTKLSKKKRPGRNDLLCSKVVDSSSKREDWLPNPGPLLGLSLFISFLAPTTVPFPLLCSDSFLAPEDPEVNEVWWALCISGYSPASEIFSGPFPFLVFSFSTNNLSTVTSELSSKL